MIEYPWDYIFAIVGAIGSLTTAGALFFLWRQSNQTKEQIRITQEEIESRLRPWLGISDTIIDDGNVRVVFENTGSLPAKIVRTQQSLSFSPITQEQLRSGKDITAKVVILPKGKRDISFTEAILNADQYLGILVQYKYAKDKPGEIGAILKYNDKLGSFAVVDEFSN